MNSQVRLYRSLISLEPSIFRGILGLTRLQNNLVPRKPMRVLSGPISQTWKKEVTCQQNGAPRMRGETACVAIRRTGETRRLHVRR